MITLTRSRVEFGTSDNPVQFINTSSDTRYVGFYLPIASVPDSLKEFVKNENTKEVYGPYLENGSYKIAKLINIADRPDSVHARHILIQPKGDLTHGAGKSQSRQSCRSY